MNQEQPQMDWSRLAVLGTLLLGAAFLLSQMNDKKARMAPEPADPEPVVVEPVQPDCPGGRCPLRRPCPRHGNWAVPKCPTCIGILQQEIKELR